MNITPHPYQIAALKKKCYENDSVCCNNVMKKQLIGAKLACWGPNVI